MKLILCSALILVFPAAWAQTPAPSPDIDSPAKTAAPGTASTAPSGALPAPPFSGSDRALWDVWYTVSLKPEGVKAPLPYAYYNDHLELKKGQLFYKNQVWKKEEGFINEEQLGALSENGEALTPLIYNFHSNYRSVETSIDGSASGHTMTVVIKKGGQAAPKKLKKSIEPHSFFSVFFPVWLGYRLNTLKPGTSKSFKTVMEDNPDAGFETVSGTVKLENADAFATRTGTQKLTVDYGEIHTIWWVDPSGVAARIEAPDQGRVVERTTRAAAEKFLE